MPLRASIDLGNEYFRVEHISDAKDVKTALAGFSAGKRAAGLELYLKKSALTDEAECDARTYLVRDVVTDEPEANFIYGHIKPKYDQDCVFMCRRI